MCREVIAKDSRQQIAELAILDTMTNFLQNLSGAFKRDPSFMVLTHPHSALQQACEEVDLKSGESLRGLIAGLTKAMDEHDGVGMAAPQVGVMKRVLIYRVGEQDRPRVLINPRITAFSKQKVTADEGCLSFPNIYFPVERAEYICVEALDENGTPISLQDVGGFTARVIQHECDHLDGIMITQRAKPHVRTAALRAYATFDRQDQEYITITDDQDPAANAPEGDK